MSFLKKTVTFTCFYTLSQISFAAAFQFYELGAPINGTAGVGQTVIANDASVAYYNPAAMTLLKSSEFLLGTQMVLSRVHFNQNHSNTIPGNNGSEAGAFLPSADGYVVYDASPKLKFGVSLTAPYGGYLNYDAHWVGRYTTQEMVLYTLNLNPSVGYDFNNWLSIGAGFAVEYANLLQTLALPLTAFVDGQAKLKIDNTALGYNLGLLLKPSEFMRLGIAFRSQIVHQLHGDISFENISLTPNIESRLVSPANLIASISQTFNERFTLLGELGWANWSSMKNNIVTLDGFSAVTVEDWHDTYRLGIGAQYALTSAMLLQIGTSYDSSPTNASHRTPNLPMDRQIRAGVGVIYALMKPVQLGLSYEYINLGNAAIHNISNRGTLAGSYSRNFANVLQASVNIGC